MSNSDDSWDFKVDKKKTNSDKTQKTVAMPRVQKTSDLLDDDTSDLDVSASNPASRKSRKQLAQEYEREEDKRVEVHPNLLYGSFFRRGSAFGLDFLTTLIVMAAGTTFYPQFFIDAEKFVFSFVSSDIASVEAYLFFSLFIVYFVLVLAPHVVFGTSFGKKMFNVKIHGQNRESLGFLKSLIRELILKPIVLVSFLGTIICVFNDKRKMLHDFIIGSEVHRE